MFRKQDEDNFYFMAIDNYRACQHLEEGEKGKWEALAPWGKD